MRRVAWRAGRPVRFVLCVPDMTRKSHALHRSLRAVNVRVVIAGWKKHAASWGAFAASCAVALGLATWARAPEQAPATEADRRAAFRAIASDEAGMRSAAADAFPGDLWSRDDDFHRRELDRAREWAKQHHLRLSDVLSAID